MKKSLIGLFLVLALTLTACGSTQRNNFANATLSPEAKLGLGILKLEGTPKAVDAKQAATLLPLWQLLRQLNSSSSAAPEEISAVVDAIQAAMTSDQISTIDGLQLSQRDIFQTLQEMGAVGGGGFAGGGSGTPSANSTGGNNTRRNGQGGGNFQGGGGFLPGGGPNGGFGPGGGIATGNGTPSSQSQNRQNFQNLSSNLLVSQVIKTLEGKLQN